MTLEDKLRNALQHKANGIEPSADSYVTLASKVSPEKSSSIRLATVVRQRLCSASAADAAADACSTVRASTERPSWP